MRKFHGVTKNILCSFERAFEITNKACLRFFISRLILEIFRLRHNRCPPSWIFNDMHVTSQLDHATLNNSQAMIRQTRSSFLLAI